MPDFVGDFLASRTEDVGRPALPDASIQSPRLPLGQSVGQPLLSAWSVPRRPEVAVEEILDASNPLHDTDVLAGLWQLVEEDTDLDSAWRSNHPQLTDVLEAVATHHPKDRIGKAAKKALFKARQRNP